MEVKTRKSVNSVSSFIEALESESVRDDCKLLDKLMSDVTGNEARMWGPSIVGYGDYHYKYESGHEGDTFILGFSPRKDKISIYFCIYLENFKKELDKLGKHKTGKGCLYIKSLRDINPDILKDMMKKAVSMK